MALGNYLFAGSYTNIHKIEHDKVNKSVQITVCIYSDSTKSNLLFAKDIYIPFSLNWPVILGILPSAPASPNVNDRYINQSGLLLQWNGSGWVEDVSQGVFNLSDSKPYRKGTSSWNEIDTMKIFYAEIVQKWDILFSIEALGLENQYIKAYKYLKTMQEFKDCTDC